MRALPALRRSRPAGWSWVARRASQVVVLGLLTAYAAVSAGAVAANWFSYDALGYWDAGLRLRSGGDLYPPIADQDDPSVYRYAPWFAWLWAALTYLPQPLVMAGWMVALAVSSVWLLLQLPRNFTGLALVLLFGPMLLRVISQGNVQPLIVAALAWGIGRRSGPAWIGMAASLKVVPIFFIGLYMARRQYARAAAGVVISAVLWAPAVAYGLAYYPTRVGGEAFPFGWLTFIIAAVAFGAIFILPARYRALATAVAVSFASPRWIPYNPTYLLVGTNRSSRDG